MPSPDFIIVGGGTAGLVVANRLSEDPDVQVLVLEAGEDLTEDPRVIIPAMWTTLLGSDADWQFSTAAQPGLKGRSIRQPRGKALGGSSAINGQTFVAPSRVEINAWGQLGNPGWDWEGLVPYFKKSYTLIPPADEATRQHLGIDWVDEAYRGTDGPLQVSFPGVKENPLCKAWIDAFRGMHKLTTGDPFSGKSTGAYSNAASVDPASKTRSYAASAYGLPLKQRPNVRVITGADVSRILFDETNQNSAVATGVQASVGGKLQTFHAAKEVVLAAGSISTPKLLELSGVGDPGLLAKHGIHCVVDLPGVGENLQDHLMTGMSYEVNDGVMTGDPLLRQEPEALAMAQKLYVEHKAGPLTIGGLQSAAFMPLQGDTTYDQLMATSKPRPQDAEYVKQVRSILDREEADSHSASWFMFLAQANLHENGESFVGKELLPGNYASLGCSQTSPFSRGATHIASADPAAKPDIDPRYFSHPADLEIMARHVQALDKLRHVPELDVFFKKDGRRNHPDAHHIADLEGAKKYVLDTATTTYHACGTTAMLPREKAGVVSPELVVYGTRNLRVVDAGIFPLVSRGNIMSLVYAVAEKAADVIKAGQGN
ncbi:glucose-methanol-choline oxidoreductase [Apiospora marii]|uniref:glucose-methanol-choline oxidoreductase n=1 Tax=Apiospora marii TaxID=335849 RepID=UPI00312FDAFF